MKILEPFEAATTFFSSEENTSISSSLPVLLGLVEGLMKEPESESDSDDSSIPSIPAVQKFKWVVAEEISRRWDLKHLEISDPFVLAPIVDLRFKLIQSLSEDDKVCIKANIIEQMNSFSMPVVTHSGSEDEVEPMEVVEVSEPVQEKGKRLTALGKLLGPEYEEDGLTCETELEQYLNEKPVKRNKKPLTWWKNNDKCFPKLAKVARSLLNIQVLVHHQRGYF